MRSTFSTLASIINFFLPAEVLSAVMIVFAMENVLDAAFTAYFGEEVGVGGWLAVYVIGIILIGLLNYYSATDEERDDLEDDIEDL